MIKHSFNFNSTTICHPPMSFHADSFGISADGKLRNTPWRMPRPPVRRGGRGGAFSNQIRPPPQPSLKQLGPAMDSISIDTLLTEEEAPKIDNVQYVSSYNWLDDKSPVILVPGQSLICLPLSIDGTLTLIIE